MGRGAKRGPGRALASIADARVDRDARLELLLTRYVVERAALIAGEVEGDGRFLVLSEDLWRTRADRVPDAASTLERVLSFVTRDRGLRAVYDLDDPSGRDLAPLIGLRAVIEPPEIDGVLEDPARAIAQALAREPLWRGAAGDRSVSGQRYLLLSENTRSGRREALALPTAHAAEALIREAAFAPDRRAHRVYDLLTTPPEREPVGLEGRLDIGGREHIVDAEL